MGTRWSARALFWQRGSPLSSLSISRPIDVSTEPEITSRAGGSPAPAGDHGIAALRLVAHAEGRQADGRRRAAGQPLVDAIDAVPMARWLEPASSSRAWASSAARRTAVRHALRREAERHRRPLCGNEGAHRRPHDDPGGDGAGEAMKIDEASPARTLDGEVCARNAPGVRARRPRQGRTRHPPDVHRVRSGRLTRTRRGLRWPT